MKLFVLAGALLISQASFAADLRVSKLECGAVNSLGYADLRLNPAGQVDIVVNSAFKSEAKLSKVEPSAIVLEQSGDSRQYRIEFVEALKAGPQKLEGSLYSKYTPSSPWIFTSYANCRLELVEAH